ncbi:MAG: putative ABC transporter permease [Lachnospiraceae bacterium]|nr:putative ABC transporter permease [Lachnospiraceae bacterium]
MSILFPMKTIKSFPQFWVNFFKCGITGWCLEVIFTSAESIIAGDMRLIGQTSLLMFPIYGMGALLAPVSRWVDLWIADGSQGAGTPLNPIDKIIRHGFLYMVLIFTAEYLAGMFLRNMGICPWDYTGRHLNVNGLIRLDFAPLWFLTGLLFEQLTSLKRV